MASQKPNNTEAETRIVIKTVKSVGLIMIKPSDTDYECVMPMAMK